MCLSCVRVCVCWRPCVSVRARVSSAFEGQFDSHFITKVVVNKHNFKSPLQIIDTQDNHYLSDWLSITLRK